MKLRAVILLRLIVLTITANTVSAKDNTTMTPLDFAKQYELALATQKWEAVSPLIHERASVVFSNGSVHKGKDAIRAAYERNFETIKSEHYQITNLHWLLKSADTAVYMFDFAWTGVIAGEKASGGGRGTTVLLYEHGKWQLLAEHLGYPEH